ncbi:MAG: baseplate J/gp47 family protein, partial [Bacteroidota bacterium]
YVSHPNLDEEDFQFKLDYLQEQNWENVPPDDRQLFGTNTTPINDQCPAANGFTVDENMFSACLWPLNLSEGYQPDTQCGFLRWKLGEQDFLHSEYVEALMIAAQVMNTTETTQELVADFGTTLGEISTGLNDVKTSLDNVDCDNPFLPFAINALNTNIDELEVKVDELKNDFRLDGLASPPNEPYTPTIENISLDYTASDQVSGEEGLLQLTHLHPWEGSFEPLVFTAETDGTATLQSPAKNTLLPCFLDQGNLYIGLAGYQAGELLNLYFELDPATANPDVEKAVTNWYYLKGNTWMELKDELQVLSDTTAGLIQPGIVQLAVPSDMSSEGTTILPAQWNWVRVSVPQRSAAIAATLLVSTQAAVGTFVPAENNTLERLNAALPAETIAKTVDLVGELKSITQPYPSFGGRAPELPNLYHQRISENLRHKGLGVTLHDYERLVLEAFPQVYRVKCLNHTLGRRGKSNDYEMAPGYVTIVVVPDLSVVSAVNPFEPRLPAADLEAIKIYLEERISPFVKLRVLNPIYEHVRTTMEVKFLAGKSEEFYKDQLQKDLRLLLAPWTRETAGEDITFGGRVYYSTVVNYVERLSYVDYVRNLGIVPPVEGGLVLNTENCASLERISFQAATSARSILTTVNGQGSSKTHCIKPI